MHSEEYWNLMRLRIALKVSSVEEVMSLLGANQEVMCARMKNRACAVGKKLDISSNLRGLFFMAYEQP